MKLMRALTPSQAKVFSGLFTDLAAAWLITLLTTLDVHVLTMNIFFATISLFVAIKLEELYK